MTVLSGDSAAELFTTAARFLLARGALSAPRGLSTREVLGVHLHLNEPRRRLIHLPPVRVLNTAFAVAEAMWILSGSDEPWIFDYNSQLIQYADNGLLQGAYGPRLRRWQGVDQLDQVRRLLLSDPDTRRAVVQLFDPAKDHVGHSDVPCTLGYRFFLRGNRLHMHTTMRSQDLWLGFPYDVFTATIIHELMAGWIGAELGQYRHTVDSLHLYAQHWDAAAELPITALGEAMAPLAASWEESGRLFMRIVDGQTSELSGVWADMATVLSSYRCWKATDREQARDMAAGLDGPLGDGLRGWYEHLAPAGLVMPS